jgi:hypothetical protein
MAEEKTHGAGTLTEDASGENTVQATFLLEGKTVRDLGEAPSHGKSRVRMTSVNLCVLCG